jgi:hypothetical protein
MILTKLAASRQSRSDSALPGFTTEGRIIMKAKKKAAKKVAKKPAKKKKR